MGKKIDVIKLCQILAAARLRYGYSEVAGDVIDYIVAEVQEAQE